MVGRRQDIGILVCEDTERLDRAAGNTLRTLSFVDILDEDRCLFAVRLDLRGDDGRCFAFYQRDGSGQAFSFLLGNECQVIENVD